MAGHPNHFRGTAQLHNKTSCSPGRPAGQLISFYDNDIFDTQLGQMVRSGAADNSSTDDDNLGMAR